jgi:hypothetical protein
MKKNKKGLELKGISSFSGYLTSMMEEMICDMKHLPDMPLIWKNYL